MPCIAPCLRYPCNLTAYILCLIFLVMNNSRGIGVILCCYGISFVNCLDSFISFLVLVEYPCTVLLLFTWPPVRGVCPNYEVVMFQPRTVTPPYLVSVVNCYVSYSFKPAPPFSELHPLSSLEGLPAPALSLSPVLTVVSPHRII